MIQANQNIGRREFLQIGGAAATCTFLFPGSIAEATERPTARIALQLYTVRKELEKDMAGTLGRLTAIGFETVETAFWPKNVTVQEAANNLRNSGLNVSSCHIEIPVGDKKEAMLTTAEAFDCKRMIWHGWPEDRRYSSLDGTKELIDIYNDANLFAKSNGLLFGLHNHWWEYRNRVGGRLVYEWLLDGTDKDIFFEIDTYWVKVAGLDPADIIGKFGKRAQLLHMKDGPARWSDSLPKDNPEPMVALGQGTQNFPAIVKAAKGKAEWMIVEMDLVATDVFQALKESYQYLVKNDFALGKKVQG